MEILLSVLDSLNSVDLSSWQQNLTTDVTPICEIPHSWSSQIANAVIAFSNILTSLMMFLVLILRPWSPRSKSLWTIAATIFFASAVSRIFALFSSRYPSLQQQIDISNMVLAVLCFLMTFAMWMQVDNLMAVKREKDKERELTEKIRMKIFPLRASIPEESISEVIEELDEDMNNGNKGSGEGGTS